MSSGKQSKKLRKAARGLAEKERALLDAVLSGEHTGIAIHTERSVSKFSGPLPPPQVLEEYDRISPGAADIIIGMAKSQMEHRQKLESAVVTGNINAQAKGQNYALVVTILAFATAIVLAWLGYPTIAGIVAGTTLTCLVGIFITSRYMQSDERVKKNKDRQP